MFSFFIYIYIYIYIVLVIVLIIIYVQIVITFAIIILHDAVINICCLVVNKLFNNNNWLHAHTFRRVHTGGRGYGQKCARRRTLHRTPTPSSQVCQSRFVQRSNGIATAAVCDWLTAPVTVMLRRDRVWVSYISFITKRTRAVEACIRRLVVLVMVVTEVTILYWLIWDASSVTRSECVALISQMVNILC